MSSSGLGLRQGMLTNVYQEFERLRRTKLQAARRERERIIAEESGEERKSREKVVMGGREARMMEERGNLEATERKSTKGVLPTAALSNKVC